MTQFQHISLEDAHTRLAKGEFTVADIRDARSFEQGHIAGAFNLNNDNLADFIAQQREPQNATKALLVTCYHGVSSQNAAQYLCAQGFAEVYSLDGGMSGWTTRFPTEVERGA